MYKSGVLELARDLGAREGTVDAASTAPMLCSTADDPASSLSLPGYLYELKLDGVRILADRHGARTALFYRKLRDATASYPEIAEAVRALPADRFVLDGEIVAFDEEGRPSFQRLGRRIGLRSARDVAAVRREVPVAYVAFDVLAIGPYDLRPLPLSSRRKILAALVTDEGLVRVLEDADGVALLDVCREKGLEGVVAKDVASPYRAGHRGREWIKIKLHRQDDFVVFAYTKGEGRAESLGALDIARCDHGRLVACGKVGSGLDETSVAWFLKNLRPTSTCAATGVLERAPRGRVFVEPDTVVSVKYMRWSEDGRLRAPVFRGVRADLGPEDCTASPDKTDADYYASVEAAMRPHQRGQKGLRVQAPDLLTLAVVGPERARALRDLLQRIGLEPFVKTAGRRELHVVVPVGPGVSPEAARAFADLLGAMAGFTVRLEKDFLVPYAIVEGDLVSTPLEWTELDGFDAGRYTIRSAAARAVRCPMARLPQVRADFAASVTRLEELLRR